MFKGRYAYSASRTAHLTVGADGLIVGAIYSLLDKLDLYRHDLIGASGIYGRANE